MLGYFAYCNLGTSAVKSFEDDLAVRNGPVSGIAVLLLRFAEGKPSFASISPNMNLPTGGHVGGCARKRLAAAWCRVSYGCLWSWESWLRGQEASGRCLVQGKLEVLVKLIAAWGDYPVAR
jgi:hypothetical protein